MKINIELPCIPGTDVYVIDPSITDGNINKCIVREFCIEESGIWVVLYNPKIFRRHALRVDCFNKTIFLSKATAVKAKENLKWHQ